MIYNQHRYMKSIKLSAGWASLHQIKYTVVSKSQPEVVVTIEKTREGSGSYNAEDP